MLNPDHRYGASKARFFGAFGFRIHWHCPVCNDNGFISGWQATLWDRFAVNENAH
jgi:hypothetical protein